MNGHSIGFIRFNLPVMVGVVAAFAMNGAWAQDPSPPANTSELEEVLVTGIRLSLQKATDLKHEAVNNVESVLAEDIAKMPDLNLAESIQRIPGVAMSREGGEGRNVTLRGFAPDFTRTTLNGMEIPASSDGLDSGGFTINAGRSFDFHLFASELFNRIDVQKTQKASTGRGRHCWHRRSVHRATIRFQGKDAGRCLAGRLQLSVPGKTDPRATLAVQRIRLPMTLLASCCRRPTRARTVHQEGYGSVRWTSPFANGDSWADTNPTVTGTPDRRLRRRLIRSIACGRRALPRADFFGNDQERIGLDGVIPVSAFGKIAADFRCSALGAEERPIELQLDGVVADSRCRERLFWAGPCVIHGRARWQAADCGELQQCHVLVRKPSPDIRFQVSTSSYCPANTS